MLFATALFAEYIFLAIIIVKNSLKIYPQFTSCFVGYETGDFYMLRRHIDGYLVRKINKKTNHDHVITYDNEFNEISIKTTNPPYNLEQRPWYKNAINNPDGIVVTILCDRGERYFSVYEW